MTAWHVYLNGKRIDTVFYESAMTRSEVLESLIKHDGYSPNIIIIVKGA
jgi:hypothetical protein